MLHTFCLLARGDVGQGGSNDSDEADAAGETTGLGDVDFLTTIFSQYLNGVLQLSVSGLEQDVVGFIKFNILPRFPLD